MLLDSGRFYDMSFHIREMQGQNRRVAANEETQVDVGDLIKEEDTTGKSEELFSPLFHGCGFED